LRFKTSLSVTGFWQEGNVQTLILRGRSDISIRPSDDWVYKTTNSYVYQAFSRDKADEDFLSLNFLYYKPERRLYPLALGFLSTNFRREIRHRYLIGTGLTYQIIQHKDHWLKCSITAEYEETSFRRSTFNLTAFNGNDEISTMRGTLWINGQYQLLDKKVILRHESYFQPSLAQSENYRWEADVSLDFPLSKVISFRVNYRHTYENLVIAGQDVEDQFVTFGLTAKNF